MHHPWADFLHYAPFLLQESSNAPTLCFSIYWNLEEVGITRFSPSTLREGITITLLKKNPVRDVEMASAGASRAWQVIPCRKGHQPGALCAQEQSPAPLCSLGFSLQAPHLISFNLTFAPGEVFTRFLFQDYH